MKRTTAVMTKKPGGGARGILMFNECMWSASRNHGMIRCVWRQQRRLTQGDAQECVVKSRRINRAKRVDRGPSDLGDPQPVSGSCCEESDQILRCLLHVFLLHLSSICVLAQEKAQRIPRYSPELHLTPPAVEVQVRPIYTRHLDKTSRTEKLHKLCRVTV